MRKTFAAFAAAAIFGFLPSIGAQAADYPRKPIEMIVAYGAGGSTDIMARIFAKYAGERLGQRVVVINKPGAGGEIGWTALANAKPDGYTIGLINSPVVEVYPFTRAKTVGYDLKKIKPLVNVVTDPGMIAVSADSPYKTLKDFLDAVKARPGEVTLSHEGIGGDDHLAALNVQKATGAKFKFVTFNGNAEATVALLGGHIQAFEGNMSEAAAQIKEGKIRGLAIWAAKRQDAVPDVPTGAEQGANVIAAASRGVAVPAGLPKDVYEKLLAVSREVVADPAFRAELAKLNMPINPMFGDEYQKFLDDSFKTLKAMWDAEPWIKE
jgi:tripartite-type tricarboxylate transporter receptor subunit TctC